MVERDTPTANQIAWGEVPKIPLTPGEMLGENPSVPIMDALYAGEAGVEEDFPVIVDQFVEDNPELMEEAVASGEDVVARMDRRKKVVFFIGAGAAVMATVAGIVVYKHRKNKAVE